MENEFNFIHEKLPESDRELFFGPITVQDRISKISDTTMWPDILVECKIFASKSQARKNMANIKGISDLKPGPGWTSLVIGKKKIRIYVLNYFE